MPVPLAAKAGIIAVSVAVAAAIAIYESPELRRYADDLRRRIAEALHSLGDGIQPPAGAEGEPVFNRPEDAEGFLESRRGVGAEPGVDADEETRRRQREELMYWNALHLEKKIREEQARREAEAEAERGGERAAASSSSTSATPAEGVAGLQQLLQQRAGSPYGSTFDDFLRQDAGAERGTFVFNTGAQHRPDDDGLVQRRPRGAVDGVRGLNAALYLNPFADENHIDDEDNDDNLLLPAAALATPTTETATLAPDRDEILSDIYSASTRAAPVVLSPLPASILAALSPAVADPHVPAASLLDGDHDPLARVAHVVPSTPTLERELAPDEYMTAGQPDRDEAYASIQAWAQGSALAAAGAPPSASVASSVVDGSDPAAARAHPTFYSPLPMSPAAPMSEPELVSDPGDATPTDSASLAGSGLDVGRDDAASAAGGGRRPYDVLSESDGMATPASWSEVGSVVSDYEGPMHA